MTPREMLMFERGMVVYYTGEGRSHLEYMDRGVIIRCEPDSKERPYFVEFNSDDGQTWHYEGWFADGELSLASAGKT